MDTPPAPCLGRCGKNQTLTNNPKTKTPFQSSSLYQRSFRSELQPKPASRFQQQEATNARSNTRFYPATSHRPNISRPAINEPNISLITRLGSVFSKKTEKLEQVKPLEVKQDEVVPRNLVPDTRVQKVTHTNVNNNHIQRAHSEPIIKYQVKVNDKTYKILRKIGSGGSAKVYEGFEPQSSQSVAIKIINIAKADARTQESYFNEKCILTKLRDSKHVVRMYDSEYKSDCKELIIVMEKGDADLSQVIESHFQSRENVIDGIFIKFYWRGMVLAVNEIHKKGIIHADLKPVNFILVKNEIKLIDFGIAGTFEPDVTSIVRDYQIGTINYMAPEALKNRANDLSFQQMEAKDLPSDENNPHTPRRTVIKYNAKVDIWSLGCILYNLVYGRPPFDRYKDIVSKAQAISNPNHKIDYPEISNERLLKCMRSCLRYNPADRPTTHELLRDPYLLEDALMVQKDK